MSKVTFGAIFGGPKMPQGFVTGLNAIEAGLSGVDFPFAFDLSLTIGGDMISVTKTTGLHAPRIMMPQERVTGTIFINTNDSLGNPDAERFLKTVVHSALCDILDRLEKKKVAFDKAKITAQLDFLRV